jgi:hypothetical protein
MLPLLDADCYSPIKPAFTKMDSFYGFQDREKICTEKYERTDIKCHDASIVFIRLF